MTTAQTSRVVSTLVLGALVACVHGACASGAQAWDWFRAENGNVREGNERLRANDATGAQRSYELAARELPSEPGVHLDRGLALLAQDEHDKAREAFLLATEPPAPAAIRAAAYYDLGLAFYRQADAAATAAGADAVAQGGAIPGGPAPLPGAPPGAPTGAAPAGGAPAPQADHREAQRLFREAADGFRRSLRIVPGNRDAAWNLELALRRLREEEEAQRQEDEQRRAEQEQQQQQQDQQQAQNDPNAPPQDGQQGDQQQQDQQQQQPQQGDQQQQDQQQRGDQQQQDQQAQNDPSQQQDQQQQQQDQQQQQQQPGEQNGDQGGQREQGQESPRGDGLPGDVARVLDALQDGEDNLERYRARARALRENRAPAQDW